MTNQNLLKRLQELQTAERDVASSMDMPQENTANWEYAETAALARSAILQQQEELKQLRDEVTALRLDRDTMLRDMRTARDRALALSTWLDDQIAQYPRGTPAEHPGVPHEG